MSAKTAGHPCPATAVSACCCAEGVASTNGERAIGGYNQMLCTGESAPAVCARSRCTHTEESGTHTSGTVTSGLASTDSWADALVACTTTVGQAPSITGWVPIQCDAASLSTALIEGAATTVNDTAARARARRRRCPRR